MARIYSPSQTRTYTECPVKWHLSRRWQPKYLTQSDASRLHGVAFAAGAAMLNKGGDRGEADIVLKKTFAEELSRCLDRGQRWAQDVTADDTPTLPAAALAWYADHPVLQYPVVHVEQPFPDFGDARPDLVVSLGDGLLVVDYKYRTKLESKWIEKSLDEYRDDPQLLHYCWMLRSMLQPVAGYAIVLVTAQPKPAVHFRVFETTDSQIARWHTSVTRKWKAMDDFLLWEGPHYGKFGPCPYLAACLDYDRVPSLMTRAYVEVVR